MFNSILGKLVVGLLGDKTCTVIGLILGYVIAFYADFSKYVPEKYAGYVATGIGALTTIFGAFVVRPGKASDVADKLDAKLGS